MAGDNDFYAAARNNEAAKKQSQYYGTTKRSSTRGSQQSHNQARNSKSDAPRMSRLNPIFGRIPIEAPTGPPPSFTITSYIDPSLLLPPSGPAKPVVNGSRPTSSTKPAPPPPFVITSHIDPSLLLPPSGPANPALDSSGPTSSSTASRNPFENPDRRDRLREQFTAPIDDDTAIFGRVPCLDVAMGVDDDDCSNLDERVETMECDDSDDPDEVMGCDEEVEDIDAMDTRPDSQVTLCYENANFFGPSHVRFTGNTASFGKPSVVHGLPEPSLVLDVVMIDTDAQPLIYKPASALPSATQNTFQAAAVPTTQYRPTSKLGLPSPIFGNPSQALFGIPPTGPANHKGGNAYEDNAPRSSPLPALMAAAGAHEVQLSRTELATSSQNPFFTLASQKTPAALAQNPFLEANSSTVVPFMFPVGIDVNMVPSSSSTSLKRSADDSDELLQAAPAKRMKPASVDVAATAEKRKRVSSEEPFGDMTAKKQKLASDAIPLVKASTTIKARKTVWFSSNQDAPTRAPSPSTQPPRAAQLALTPSTQSTTPDVSYLGRENSSSSESSSSSSVNASTSSASTPASAFTSLPSSQASSSHVAPRPELTPQRRKRNHESSEDDRNIKRLKTCIEEVPALRKRHRETSEPSLTTKRHKVYSEELPAVRLFPAASANGTKLTRAATKPSRVVYPPKQSTHDFFRDVPFKRASAPVLVSSSHDMVDTSEDLNSSSPFAFLKPLCSGLFTLTSRLACSVLSRVLRNSS